MPADGRDILRKEDYEIFELTQKDVDYFTNYYLRSATSGTLFTPFTDDERILRNYEVINREYLKLLDRKPKFPLHGITYDVAQKDGAYTYFYHHGVFWQNWQKKAFHAPQPDFSIVGGFGSGKTMFIALSLITLASILPDFQGYAVAPQMSQAMQTYKLIKQISEGTPWMDRWVTRTSEYRNPGFTLRNNYIRESKIEFLSIETDPEKVLTLEGDAIFLDQAEKFDNLAEITRNIGSRLRGTVNGRNRLNRLVYLANSNDNPEIWYRFDLAEVEPKNYYSVQVSSMENTALSKKDIEAMKRRIGGTEKDIEQYMKGGRPEGDGEMFTKEVIDRSVDQGLNDVMKQAISLRETLRSGDPALDWYSGFILSEEDRAGIYRWEMPPDHRSGRKYMTIGDPGQGNPPWRNAPTVMVWDITDFTKGPAVLRAFHWIHGNGEYWPFVTQFIDYVKRYRCYGTNAFDSTGTQKAFAELVFEHEDGFMTTPMDMSGPNSKYSALNALLFLMQRGKMVVPHISAIRLQLSRYKLPDTKLAQDIVMVMAMSAQFLRQYFYHEVEIDDTATNRKIPTHTYNRSPRSVRRPLAGNPGVYGSQVAPVRELPTESEQGSFLGSARRR
jgi:hypothetical protein